MPRRCQSLPMKYVAALDVQAPVILQVLQGRVGPVALLRGILLM